MKTKVNIFNDEWCDLLFIGKNQGYGAYELRRSSSDRHFMAVLITLVILLTAGALSMIIKKKVIINLEDVTKYGKVVLVNIKPIEAITIKIPTNPSPRKPQIRITPPVIVADENITEPVDLPTNDSVNGSDLAIGSHTDLFADPSDSEILTDGGIGIIKKPDNTIHDIVEQMPQFPGGNGELLKYLSKNIIYPQIASDNGSSGTVYIEFVINYLGQATNIVVARGFERSCENEAIRVIKSMPKWIPGKQNGNAVNVKMVVPVRFVLK